MANPAPPSDPVEENGQPAKINAFLDANIILEGKPLEELPWEEVDSEGPILALITAQVIQELDSKKRDGRLAPVARAFNRRLGELGRGGKPAVIREASPRVELAIAKPGRIPWADYDELDPEDGDARVVAEALHARGISDAERVVVSHDIKPILYATGRNLRTVHVSDDWLRPPEPSPNDKAIQRLKQQVRELQSTEPEFEIEIEYTADTPAELYKAEPLTTEQSAELHVKLLAQAPRQQRRNDLMMGLHDYDHNFDDRFKLYAEKKLPYFLLHYHRKMELHFNQRPIRITVKNAGAIRADKLVVEIACSEGWLHDKLVFVSPMGPTPPRPRNSLMPLYRPMNLEHLVHNNVGRHDIEIAEGPNRSTRIVIHCEDFRHGREWVFKGIIGLDVHRPEPLELTARVTASNMHGTREETVTIQKVVVDKKVEELIDLKELRYVARFPLQAELERLLKAKDYGAIDSTGAEDGEIEDDDE